MKFQNKRNGQVAKVVEQNDKFKTVMHETEDGKTISISASTFKRWWKKIEDEESSVSTESIPTENQVREIREITKRIQTDKKFAKEALQVVDQVIDEKKLESIKKNLKDKGKGLAEKSISKKKTSKGNSELRDNLEQEILGLFGADKKFSALTYEKLPHLFIVQQNMADKSKTRFELRSRRNGYTLNLKYEVAEVLELPFHMVKNYYLPAVVKVDSFDIQTLETILNYYESKEEK